MEKYILVYGDEGTSQVGVDSLMAVCEKKLGLKCNKIMAKDIIETDVLDNCKILIFPGGMANFYCRKLNGKGNEKIKNFVNSGGMYLGICAGAYYACDRLDFHGEEFDVVEEWELKFFKGIAKGSLNELTVDNRYYDETSYAKNFVKIKQFDNGKIINEEEYYYHGGPTFISDKDYNNYEVIGRFENGKTAIIKGEIGKGKYFLSSVHFELQGDIYKKIILDNMENDIGEGEKLREKEIYSKLTKNYGNNVWKLLKDIL